MRILGLDYGSKRIGVAICDELGITAQGLATITRKNRRQVLEEIAGFIRTYAVEKIVIGYPVKLDGTEGIQCDKINKFARLLESAFALPVTKWDETLTTKEAEEILIMSNVRREHRKSKIDKLAAVLILQGYLDSQRCYEKDKNHP
ncbi:MAG TPA: Holliday junction resolvase RuvX [Syntrophales bacterium]|nr:Holliday junction resolvase RuvX [Syntrophales bacterium]